MIDIFAPQFSGKLLFFFLNSFFSVSRAGELPVGKCDGPVHHQSGSGGREPS